MADRSVVVSLRADVNGFTAGMGRAAAAAKGLGTTVDGVQSSVNHSLGGLGALGARSESAAKSGGLLSGAFKEFGGLATVAGVSSLGLAAGIGMAAKSFMDFDAKMASVRANIGATGSESAKLGSYIRDAGTQFGFSATQSADAADDLAKAGLNTSQVMGGALTSALALAAAGNVSTGESAEMLATSMSQFGIKVSSAADAAREYGHAADLIAAGADKSTASVHSLSEGLQNVGGVANQFGISMQDTVGVLAEFDQSGLKGAEGGTALKVMLQQLVNQSAPVQKAFEQYGINAFDAQGKFKGLSAFAGELRTKLGGLSDQQRMAALSTMFGSHAVQAATILYKDGAEGVKKWSNEVNDSGFAARNAAAKTDSLQGDLNKLKSEVMSLLIQTGQLASGPLRALAKGLTDVLGAGKPLLSFVQGIVQVFGSLPGPVKDAAMAFAAFKMANSMFGTQLGAARTGVTNFVGGLRDVSQVTGTVVKTTSGASQTMGHFGSTIAAIGRDIPVIGSMQQKFVEASSAASRMPRTVGAASAAMSGLKSAASGAIGAVGGPFQAALIAAPLAIEAIEGLGRAMSSLPDTSVEKARQNILGLSASGGSLSQAVGELQSKTDGWHTAMGLMSNAFNLFNDGQVDKAKDNVKQFDQALAQMVDSGHAKEAQSYLKQQGISAADAAAKFPAYNDAIRRSGSDSKQAAEDAKKLQGGMDGAAKSAAGDADEYATLQKAIDGVAKSYSSLNTALLEQRGDARGYRAAIDDATKSLKENGRTLDTNTEAGRNNQEKLDNLASTAGKLAGATFKQTGSMAQANAVLGDAKKRYADMAVAMGMSRPEAEKLANDIIKVTDAAGKPVDINVKTDGLDAVTVALDETGKMVASLRGSSVKIPAETPNAPQVLQTLTALGLTAKQLSSDGTKVSIPTEALKAPETRKAIQGIKGATVDAKGNVTIPTSALNADATKQALSQLKNIAVQADGQIVTIPASAPNAPLVKALLEGIRGAQLNADGKTVTITSSAPMADDVRRKIQAVHGAQISTDGKTVIIDTSAPGATTARQQIIDALNAAHDKTVRITTYHVDVGGNKVADVHNGAMTGLRGGATGGAIGDLRDMKRFAAGGTFTINGTPYGYMDGRTGGKVVGPGSSTSDQVITTTSRGLVRTANDEHIIAGNEVAGFGGHAGIYRMRAMAKAGMLPRFASGGDVSGSDWAPDMSGIMAYIASLKVDPSALTDERKKVTDQQSALNKAIRDVKAARASLAGKSGAARIKAENAVATALERQAKAQRDLNDHKAKLSQMEQGAKADTTTRFMMGETQQNGITKRFLDNIDRIRSRGFPRLALSLLNQGDGDAQAIAQTLSGGALSRLRDAQKGLDVSDALADRKKALTDQLAGVTTGTLTANATQQANAQLLALRAANTPVISGGGTIQFSTAALERRIDQLAASMHQVANRPIQTNTSVQVNDRELAAATSTHVFDNGARQDGWGRMPY